MSVESFTLPAFAKINLLLRVVGRRADGYHEIRTVFQTITLHDRLTFEPLEGEGFQLVSSSPNIPADERNLVARAAAALREKYGVRQGGRVTLEKEIPAQGGLGGGSSDAATALVGLAHLWEVRTGRDELAELGARLGADVPFFLTGGTALGTGIGTDIRPLEDVPKQHLVVVVPGVGISTKEAYEALNAPALTKAESVANLSVSCAEAQILDSLHEVIRNDFEAVVEGLRPETRRAKEALTRTGARRAMLSGSGSGVYGFFDDEGEAERASQLLTTESGWKVFPCATLSRAEYLQALGQCAALLDASRGA
jgi:4-diphosphocytidyl-2-C-methyl-D-erythritol kinase